MGNRKHTFYIRKFGESDFHKIEKNNYSDLNLLLIRSDAVEETYKVFCSKHKKWERVSEFDNENVISETGEFFAGYPVEYAEIMNENISSYDYSYYDSNISNFRVFKASKGTYDGEILQIHHLLNKQRNSIKEKENLLDEKGVSKDLFAIETIFDFDRHYVCVRNYYLDRTRIENNDLEKAKIIQDFGVPVVISEGNCDLKKNKFWINKKLNKNILPGDLPAEFVEDIVELLNNWAGKKISFNCCLKDYDLLEGIAAIPYEPNIWGLNGLYDVKQDPQDSNVYNHFVEKIGIKSYPTLRKMFYEDPSVLYKYDNLVKCGFKDVNIINSILASKDSSILCQYSLLNEVMEFLKKTVPVRGEKGAWNVLVKNPRENEFFKDGLKMFNEYYSKLPAAVIKSIFADGFNRYNHDVLSKIVSDLQYEKIDFEYTAEQKLLEDEIEDYKFMLPENSDELREIGSKLHNCVASYKNRVINKESTIVFVKKGDEIRVCIEVCGKKIWQERSDYNGEPYESDVPILEQWHKNHKLKKLY